MQGERGRIIIIGETVFDIIMDGLSPLAATPGGSMLNAAVTLGRAGLQPFFITELGTDQTGERIINFLIKQGIQTAFTGIFEGCRTTVALAYLNEEKKAVYDFFHGDSDRFPFESNIRLQKQDILLLGSFYAIKNSRRYLIEDTLKQAADAGSFVVYDPNIRSNHASQVANMAEIVLHNCRNASLVKGSDEDFSFLFNIDDPDKIYDLIKSACKNLIITSGSGSIRLYTPGYRQEYDVPEIRPVSTIGAGDNFNAGLMFGIYHTGIHLKNSVHHNEWDYIIACATAAATAVCMTFDNFTPENFVFPQKPPSYNL